MDTWNGDNYPITRFLSETGLESMPSLQTWQQVTNSSGDLNFTGLFVENREHERHGQEKMMFVFKTSSSILLISSDYFLDYKSKITYRYQ